MALIGIHGAGSIGCYLGGRLAAAGSEVLLVGRERLRRELADSGLRVSDYRGADLRLAASAVRYDTSPAALAEADLVLVTVKSAATAQAGRELAAVLRPGTLVISFQNGLGNAAVLARELPEQVVLAGMVPFNVAHQGHGHFHQGSEGELDVAAHPGLAAWLPAFARAGLPVMPRGNMEAVLWGKLLLNLNNPVNALSGLPLKAELSQRDYRRCLALAQEEALTLMAAARIQPARLTPLPPHWIPRLMRVPDLLFRRLANRMLAIDPLARSSMWDDLEAGRATEIDWINGEVVRLGERLQLPAPVNARLVALVHAAEQGGRRDWRGDELLAQLQSAQAAAG
ncbi:2-dehydropantoate 2-reductase [Amnimonas aquatica]|uniref:2-dehydropantoate 2-reductase n=1 Tax=Amnimonas aquatica TaxID=2094561 RepID=A0A2P6AQI3_9GAMM|nr:2-dehydropantoate 2-reductase [Amnimonas aquatica]PQA31199.1 2-dehydropantoate 2-reductase [Amnimonas aquatica]